MNKYALWFLGVLGFLGMFAELIPGQVLKGLAAGTCASPRPKVFTTVQGLETFSTGFVLHFTDDKGKEQALPITGKEYRGIQGPYNRRNVFGAAMAYGPVLPESLRDPVTRYALCKPAALLKEMGISWDAKQPVWVTYHPRPGTPEGLQLTLKADCQAVQP